MKKTIVRLSFFCMIGAFLSAAESGSQKYQSWFAWARSFFYPSTVSKQVSSTSPSQNCMNVSEQSQAQKVEARRQLLEKYRADHIVTNDNVRILELEVANATTAEELEELFDVINDGNTPSLHVEFSENFGWKWSNGEQQDSFRAFVDKKYQELRFPGRMAQVLNSLSNVHMRHSWTNVANLERYYREYLKSDEAKKFTQRQLSELQRAYEYRRATILDPKAAQKEDEAIDKAREDYQAKQLLRLKKLIEEREKEAERDAKRS